MPRDARWYDDMGSILDQPADTYAADLEARNRAYAARNAERWPSLQALLDHARPVEVDAEAMDAWLAAQDADPLYGAEE